jgi:hypothetical protein
MHQLFIDFKRAYDSVRREALYNILIQSDIPRTLVSLIKMCLNETYSRVCVGKYLSHMFPIKSGLKQGDSLSPLFLNFALEYIIRRIQVHQDGLKLNGTPQLLVYVDEVHTLCRSIHTIKKNTEALVAANKEIGLEVNADITDYVVMPHDQNAGQIHNLKTDNNFQERVEQFKYLGTTLENQNSVQEEIMSRLKSENVCYHLGQNLLSSSLLSKNIKIKIYGIIILPVFYRRETWSLTLKEERRHEGV